MLFFLFLDRIIKQCSPECTNGGTCDLDTGMCKCPPNAEGLDCSGKSLGLNDVKCNKKANNCGRD